MKIPSKRVTIVSIVACVIGAGIWIFFEPFLSSQKYYHPSLIGCSKDQVIRQAGEPTSIPEAGGGDIWIYQFGMDPEASITFSNGKVCEVWTAYRDGFTKR